MRLRLAIPDLVSSSYFPALAAVELGYFAQHGLDVELHHIFPVPACFEALRDGRADLVATSAHGPLWAFPRWQGSRILCSLSQGMYWYLIVRASLPIQRGDIEALKGLRLAAAPGVETGLRQLLHLANIDPSTHDIQIGLPPGGVPEGRSFGVVAAEALARGDIDGFWANGMAAELAISSGAARCVLDVRRGDGPREAFHFTQPALMTTDALVAERPDACAAAIDAIVATQSALRADVSLARQVGESLFPPREAALIERLVERDLDFYEADVPQSLVEGMNAFAHAAGLLDGEPVSKHDIVAEQFSHHWKQPAG